MLAALPGRVSHVTLTCMSLYWMKGTTMANITAIRFTERDRRALKALAAMRGATVSGLIRSVLTAELQLHGLLPVGPVLESCDFASALPIQSAEPRE